ncbi:hypothetical protein J1N10_11665 [Carboxylicivirga sp. A043]|uniref:hypothetical protein n=1 Tax=Carboxylicivirga litoralis TaxID=2816963 RepID=UPI0021CAF423|nr:hypothetical protein [Carboxylicivirga sp. A043]MCU4156635.1 hypothetical protein [Carboxylicivirga sp. A043]
MKTLIIIAFTISLTINGLAQKDIEINPDITPITPMQEKMLYTKYGNLGMMDTYNGKDYLKDKLEAKIAYRQLVGQWLAQEVNLKFDIQYKERMEWGCSGYIDRCLAENITHPDFQTNFDISIGGTGYDDINNLNTIFFRIGPSDFAGGVNQISVSGYLHVVDANTLRMEIKGVQHPTGENEEITIRADYTYEKAPDELLERVPKVLRRKTITFKRKGSGTGGVGITPDN